MNHLKYMAMVLAYTILIVFFAGCGVNNSMGDKVLIDVPIKDNRVPDLTPSELAVFINQYGMSSDLSVSGQTLEILRELDTWPDKMYEVILCLPEGQITDDIYEKLAQIFLRDLNNDQMARFLELCFDTYEYEKENESIILKGNIVKLEKIRSSIEQLAMTEKYGDRETLYRFGLFTSVRYIGSVISKNPFQAFSISEDINTYTIEFGEKDVTMELNSFVLNYLGISPSDGSVSPQTTTVYQTAMDSSQLNNLSTFLSGFSYDQMKEALKNRNSNLFESIRLKAVSENIFCNISAHEGYAYTKIVFSDESIRPIRMVFPIDHSANVFEYGERFNSEDETILIVAKSLQ